METLCKIRDIYRTIAEFEVRFEKEHGICLNEGMLLCTLSKEDRLSSGEIAEMLGLTTSNTSKVIKAVENKGYIKRVLGKEDKRQMYFSLTPTGKQVLESIACSKVEIPDVLTRIVE